MVVQKFGTLGTLWSTFDEVIRRII